jgi:hypothetical protein
VLATTTADIDARSARRQIERRDEVEQRFRPLRVEALLERVVERVLDLVEPIRLFRPVIHA